jgi:NADP-dependent alcohol dehydrogenase
MTDFDNNCIKNFTYYNPTRIIFGKDQIKSISKHIGKDKKVIFVYGGGSIKKNGVYDQVVKALEGYTWKEFSGIEPNPTKETLDKAVKMIKENDLDYILAVGGGSVIDGSKYIAASAMYDGDGWDILTWKHKVKKALPIGCVLTLPATGSESNTAAVITRAETQEKLPFASEAVSPEFAVLDPSTMSTLSDTQLANGVVDAFVHVCEQYVTKPQGAMVQDGHSETILKTLKVLSENWDKRREVGWQENLMWAANQALNGILSVGVPVDWATHMIGHEITAVTGLDHAKTLAVVQPSLLREVFDDKKAKLEQMAKNVFCVDSAEKAIEEIEKVYRNVGIFTTLKEYEIDSSVIPKVVSGLKKHGMVKLSENGNITPEISEKILNRAL